MTQFQVWFAAEGPAPEDIDRLLRGRSADGQQRLRCGSARRSKRAGSATLSADVGGVLCPVHSGVHVPGGLREGLRDAKLQRPTAPAEPVLRHQQRAGVR